LGLDTRTNPATVDLIVTYQAALAAIREIDSVILLNIQPLSKIDRTKFDDNALWKKSMIRIDILLDKRLMHMIERDRAKRPALHF